MWEYKAKILNVVDGDTVDVEVDLGFDVRKVERLRLYGLDAPESFTTLGKWVKAELRLLLSEGTRVYLHTYKHDKYGRYLTDIFLSTDSRTSVNKQMVEQGYAKEYFGDSKSNLWAADELSVASLPKLVLK